MDRSMTPPGGQAAHSVVDVDSGRASAVTNRSTAEVQRQIIHLDAAHAALAAGLCSIPPRMDGTKAPLPPTWKKYQGRRPTPEGIDNWYAGENSGVGLVTGAISGNLETLD